MGTAAPSHSLDCFLDFEEPLDDFLGFFIRWYFRASSLSGAAASPGGDGQFLGSKKQTGTVSGSRPRSGLWMSPVGDRLTPASCAMEKEKVRNLGPRRPPTSRPRCVLPVPPAPSSKSVASTPSSPACHASTAKPKRTGQILCPIRYCWEAVGETPWDGKRGRRQAEAARQHRDGHHEPPGVDNTSATSSRDAAPMAGITECHTTDRDTKGTR